MQGEHQSPPCLIYPCICPTAQSPGSGTQERCRKHFLNEGTNARVGKIGRFLQWPGFQAWGRSEEGKQGPQPCLVGGGGGGW